MGKILHIKYLAALALFLACAMSSYYFLTGENLADVAGVFLAVLIAAMPLALYLTQPLALRRAASAASSLGAHLVRRSALARLSALDTLVLGRDGIITTGQPYVAGLFPEGVSQAVLLAMAASAARDSATPVGQAIYSSALERGLRLTPAATFSETPGTGIEALVSRAPVRVGTAEYLASEGIKISAELLTKADQVELHGQTAIFVANGRSCRGIIALGDEVPDAHQKVLHALQRRGLRLILLTAGSRRTATAIKKLSGIDDVRYELSDDARHREVQLLQARGASVGLLTSDRTDSLLIGSAEVKLLLHREDPAAASGGFAPDILLHSLEALTGLLAITTRTSRIIRQNRYIALAAYIILVPLAMGVLHSLGGPFLSPLAALAGQLVASLLIILNSLRA